jgi:hypothetical protein
MKIPKFNSEKHVPILMGIGLSIILIYGFYQKYKIHKCHRIYVLSPIRITGGVKTGLTLHFTFTKDGREINGDDVIPKYGDKYFLKNRFFIKVSCDNENYSSGVWDFVVPDTLQYVPANGWDKIPYGLDKKK